VGREDGAFEGRPCGEHAGETSAIPRAERTVGRAAPGSRDPQTSKARASPQLWHRAASRSLTAVMYRSLIVADLDPIPRANWPARPNPARTPHHGLLAHLIVDGSSMRTAVVA